MLKKLFFNYDTFIFDLDRTVWDTYSKNGELIWAKQMITPYSIFSDRIVDDCFSVCKLQCGIVSVLKELNSMKKNVGFLSRGGICGLEYSLQPSISLLKKFDIYHFFNYKKTLLYKTDIKIDNLKQIIEENGRCVFFDDTDKDLDEARTIFGVKVVDRKGFDSWETIFE